MKVAVTGAAGQLGAASVREFAVAHDVVALDRGALDVSSDRAVDEAIGRIRPDVIINCAAYTNVDGAEEHPLDALNANAFAVRALARAAARCDATLVHYSTDFVFDGTATRPYTEDDPPNPRSTYAASKLLGEWFAEDAPRAYVLRVESLFGAVAGPPRGSVAGILARLKAGQEVRAFVDRTVSPTSVVDAARATRALLERRAAAGLYHCVNSGYCTWYELAQEAARLLGVEPHLVPTTMEGAKLRAERPKFCALSNEKLHRAGIDMPTWQSALAAYIVEARGSGLEARG
jgi:dTDP-4-dehydrorhamnose reductase